MSEAAEARLSPFWKDAYAAMVIDLARFFRPARTNGAPERAEENLGDELDAALLKKKPVFQFDAAGAGWLALTTEASANRIYRADGTRFVRAEDEVFDSHGRAWKVFEDRLQGPDGQMHPREAARRTFWFAWFAQFKDTLLFR